MDHRRNDGISSGQLIECEPLNPNLYMQGGTITEYYEYVTTSTFTPANPNPSPVGITVTNAIPALNDLITSVPPIYNIPKKLISHCLEYYLPITDPNILLNGCETSLHSVFTKNSRKVY